MIKSKHKNLPGEKPDPCPECPKYNNCEKLCDRVENWINGNTVGENPQSVILYEEYNKGEIYEDEGGVRNFNKFEDSLTQKNGKMHEHQLGTSYAVIQKMKDNGFSGEDTKIAEMVFVDGIRKSEVARKLKMSRQAIDSKMDSLSRHLFKYMKRLSFWKDYIRTETFRSDVYSLYYFHFCKLMSAAEAGREVGMNPSSSAYFVKKIKDEHDYLDYQIEAANVVC